MGDRNNSSIMMRCTRVQDLVRGAIDYLTCESRNIIYVPRIINVPCTGVRVINSFIHIALDSSNFHLKHQILVSSRRIKDNEPN